MANETPSAREVERHRAGRLVRVEEQVRADLLAAPLDRRHVLELGDLVEHVADGDEERPLVDRLEQRVQVRHDLDLRAGLRLEQVAHRGKLALDVDDPIPRRLQPEAGEDDHHRDGHVLVHARRAGAGADDPADLVADGERHVPPALAPRADAALLPHARVLGEVVLGRSRHRGQRVVDQVGGVGQDREAIPVGGHVHRRRLDGGDQERKRRLAALERDERRV